jgi:hypothetical protein
VQSQRLLCVFAIGLSGSSGTDLCPAGAKCQSLQESLFLFIAGLVCASICALGGNTIISPFVVQKLSFLTVLRYPVKLMIFVDLFICLLAAYGVTTVLAGTASKRYLKWLSIIFGSAALILGLVYLLRTTFAGQTFSYTIPFRWEVHFYSAAFL